MLDKQQLKLVKLCSACQQYVATSLFGSDKYRCKPCNKARSRRYREQNPDRCYDIVKKQQSNKETKARYVIDWKRYLVSKFGEKPQCQICDNALEWFSGNIISTVNFDHRSGGTEAIKTKRNGHASVNNWLRTRPCNEKNISIFKSCDFGILCQRCNQFLPTYERLTWLNRAIKYSKGNN